MLVNDDQVYIHGDGPWFLTLSCYAVLAFVKFEGFEVLDPAFPKKQSKLNSVIMKSEFNSFTSI